jgi:hypothetical protein
MSKLRQAKKAKKVKEGRAAVRSRSTKAGGAVESTEEITLFPDEPCYVSIRRSKTLNLGNYESERIEVGLSVPCQPEKINEVAESVKRWINIQLVRLAGQVAAPASEGL